VGKVTWSMGDEELIQNTVTKPEGQRIFRSLRDKRIKVNHKEIGIEDTKWIYLAKDKVQ
jgi:hypothetical protein